MVSDIIAALIGTATISYVLFSFIYEKYRRKKARRNQLRRLMEAKIQDDYEAMEAYKAMVRKAYTSNFQKKKNDPD